MKRVMIFALLFAAGLHAQGMIYESATGRPTTVLAPLALYSLIGSGCTAEASYETTDPGTLPTSLGGCSVTVDGVAAGLTYVSPLKIVFQAPLSGSIVVSGNATIPVSFVNATPAAYSYSGLNGVPVPYLTNLTGDLTQGSHAFPLLIDPQIGGTFSMQLNGVGSLTDWDGTYGAIGGKIAPLQIGYGFCDNVPQVAIDHTALTIATEPDGNGVLHPACKQNGATIQSVWFLPTSPRFNPAVAHILTVGSNEYPLWIAYKSH